MDAHTRQTVQRLIIRRRKLSEAYDALIAQPASYGITGSVSATNQRLEDIRKEIAVVDTQIRALMTRGGIIERSLPDYYGGLL